MRFRKDNKIFYEQDFCFYESIPSGVDFEVKKLSDDVYKLIADGYGELDKTKGKYGNGVLRVYNLTQKQKERFEKELKHKHIEEKT